MWHDKEIRKKIRKKYVLYTYTHIFITNEGRNTHDNFSLCFCNWSPSCSWYL